MRDDNDLGKNASRPPLAAENHFIDVRAKHQDECDGRYKQRTETNKECKKTRFPNVEPIAVPGHAGKKYLSESSRNQGDWQECRSKRDTKEPGFSSANQRCESDHGHLEIELGYKRKWDGVQKMRLVSPKDLT